MKNIFTKTNFLIIFCLNVVTVFPALFSTEPLHEIVDSLTNAATRPSSQALPFQPCVLDWSKSGAGASAFKVTLRLLSDFGAVAPDSHTRINGQDLAYVACEVAAAILRNDSGICPSLASYVKNENSVYEAFGRIISVKTAALQHDISVLSDLVQCRKLVDQAMIEYMIPLVGDLLDRAGIKDEAIKNVVQTEVKTLLIPVVGPTFAVLVNKAYLGMDKAGKEAENLGKKLAGKVSTCGCFSWCK